MADNQSKTVNDDMKTRVVFESPQDAANYLYACMRDFADFASVPFVGPGISQDENSGELIFDQTIYSDDMRVSVAVISRRAGEGVPMKAFAIQINPTPTFEALLNDPQGKLWLEKIADSQLHAVATRAMRKADNPADPAVLEMIPTTLADFVVSGRENTSTLLEAFEEYWKQIKAFIGSQVKSFKALNLSKREFRRAMESASYANAMYRVVEERGAFVGAIEAFTMVAKGEGKDATIFQRWLENRDATDIDPDADDDGELSLDNLTAFLAKPKEDAPAENAAA